MNLTGSSGYQRNFVVLIHTGQPSEWNMQEGGILYDSLKMV